MPLGKINDILVAESICRSCDWRQPLEVGKILPTLKTLRQRSELLPVRLLDLRLHLREGIKPICEVCGEMG